jgi:hypothetical protein
MQHSVLIYSVGMGLISAINGHASLRDAWKQTNKQFIFHDLVLALAYPLNVTSADWGISGIQLEPIMAEAPEVERLQPIQTVDVTIIEVSCPSRFWVQLNSKHTQLVQMENKMQ